MRSSYLTRVDADAEINHLLKQMYVFVFGLESYLPAAAAANLITNEVQRDAAAISASYLMFSQGSVDLVIMPIP